MWGHKWAHSADRYTVILSESEINMIANGGLTTRGARQLRNLFLSLLQDESIPAPDQPGGKPHL